jgi:hypothetical protein
MFMFMACHEHHPKQVLPLERAGEQYIFLISSAARVANSRNFEFQHEAEKRAAQGG